MAASHGPQRVCPLYLGVDWSYDQYGIAAVNKMLIEDVNDLSQEIPVFYAVLKEEKSIQEAERKDAAKFNVTLVGAEQPKGQKKPLNFEAINIMSASFYSQVERKCQNVTHIIGHVPKLSYAPINFRKILSKKSEVVELKIILVIHDLPKDAEGNIVDDDVEEILCDADMIISLGKQTYLAVEQILLALSTKPVHKLYIPSPPIELLQLEMQTPSSDNIRGAQNILLHGSDFVNIDFDLAVSSTFKASDLLSQTTNPKDHVSFTLQIVKDPICEDDLKTKFEKLKKDSNATSKKLKFSQEVVHSKEKLSKILKKSNLCIHPTNTESSVLGLEPLMAAYAGLPVLMSDGTGAAGVFDTLNLIDSIVNTLGDFESDTEAWSSKIFSKLKDPKASYEEADRVKKTLLLDETIPNSHLDVLAEMSGSSCFNWTIDLQKIIEEMLHRNLNDFNIPVLSGIANPQEYAPKLLLYLLQQRGKVSKGLLNHYLPKSLLTIWKEFLRVLEADGRKVIGIHHGSLVLTIFCPTERSMSNLKRDVKDQKFALMNSLERLLHEIVAVSCVRKIDEQAMDVISKRFARALVTEFSGCYLRPAIKHEYMIFDCPRKHSHLPGVSDVGQAAKSSLYWTEIVSYFQNPQAFDLAWIERRIDLDRLRELAAARIMQLLVEDESHFMFRKHDMEDDMFEDHLFNKVVRELEATLSDEKKTKLITACANDPNWNAEKYVLILQKGKKMIPFSTDKQSQYGSRDFFIKLSEIIEPDSTRIRDELERVLLEQEGGQAFLENLTVHAVEKLCTAIRIALGHKLREHVKENYSQAVEAQKTLSPDSYILADLENMIVSSIYEGIKETGTARESSIKNLQHDDSETEKKIWSSFWAKLIPFIDSHIGLLNEKIVERGVTDLQNAQDLNKMVENVKTKLVKKLQNLLDQMEEEKREEISKYLEEYIPGKATRLLHLFEKQIQGYASLLDLEAMAKSA